VPRREAHPPSVPRNSLPGKRARREERDEPEERDGDAETSRSQRGKAEEPRAQRNSPSPDEPQISALCTGYHPPKRGKRGEQRNEIREEAGTPRRHAALSLHARSPLSPLSALLSLRPISEEP